MKERNEKQQQLIRDNLGLVHSCANRFRGRGTDYDDLFQAGCIGLIKAADHFDESRGFAFSTYAVPVILGEIRRIFRDYGPVKIGRTLKERSRAALKVKQELSGKLGREPTISELAEQLGLDISQTAELITVSMPTVSLTSSFDSSDEHQLDIPVPSHEQEISDRLTLRAVLASLEEKDRTLIELRYFSGLTQAKTADRLGMSQVQVSRREKAILTKMRESMG